MLDQITTIYFDLDNTLINRNAAFLACIEHFFDENISNYHFGTEQFEIEKNDHYGYNPREEFCAWFIQHYQPQGWDELSFWNYLKTNISSFVPPISLSIKNKLLKLKQNYRIGILTNGSIINQSRKINQAQLHTIFPSQNIHIAQQYHLSKPNKRLFELILEQWQLPPEQMLYIGDDPRNDILGASTVGIKTCWLSHKRSWKLALQPDLIIDTIFDLPI